MVHSRVTFCSSDLPVDLNDCARYLLWRDLFIERYGPSFSLAKAEDRNFAMRCDFAKFERVEVGRFRGTVTRFSRTQRHPTDANDDFVLGLNVGDFEMSFRQLGREGVIAPGEAVLVTNTEAGEIRSRSDNQWFAVSVPRQPLIDIAVDAERALGLPIASKYAPLLHMRRYLQFLTDSPDANATSLAHYVSSTLIDLIALVVTASRETIEISGARGLRAARLHDAISIIKANFSDPEFSVQALARTLELSTRYVHELLQESGASVTQRVNELRLQKARTMLMDSRFNCMRVSDIALSCGFKEASYFNRRFRVRFGCSPTDYRSGSS